MLVAVSLLIASLSRNVGRTVDAKVTCKMFGVALLSGSSGCLRQVREISFVRWLECVAPSGCQPIRYGNAHRYRAGRLLRKPGFFHLKHASPADHAIFDAN